MAFFIYDGEIIKRALQIVLYYERGEFFHYFCFRKFLEKETLNARGDCRRKFFVFRRGENENGVSRRFFKSFQKRVESRASKHVNFVYYVNFVSSSDRSRPNAVFYIPDFVYSAVRGGVYFNDIERRVRIYSFTGNTFVAWFAEFCEFGICVPFFAV